MNLNDFRYMRQGRQLSDLNQSESSLLKPIHQQNGKKKRALLVLHGFSSSPAVFRFLIPQIKHYDTIVCPTIPGHAESIDTFAQIHANDWLAAAKDHCARLITEYEKVDVLGLSLGGLLSCELSNLFSLNHLYLLAPALKLHMNVNLALQIARVAQCLGFVQLRNAAGNILNQEHAEITYRKLPLSTIIQMLQLARDYQWQAPRCSVDLFLGRHDAVVDSLALEQLFTPLNNTNIHWLSHSAHVLTLDNDLGDIVSCINTVAQQ